ncbi:hypothetical protein ABK046_23430 [Streptomyces caeruleatus]
MREGSERHGFGTAAKEAHFIAAPLLTAAALSLAGVVAGADDEFRWPGVTLFLLVATSMALIASIQISYYALQFKFTEEERKARQRARDCAIAGHVRLTIPRTSAVYVNAEGTLLTRVPPPSSEFGQQPRSERKFTIHVLGVCGAVSIARV